MTNLIASLVITLSTNWTTIGTFTPSCNQSGCLVDHQSEDVQSGSVETNYQAQVEFNGTTHRFLMEKRVGPLIGERRVPKAYYYIATNWWASNWVIYAINATNHSWTYTNPIIKP